MTINNVINIGIIGLGGMSNVHLQNISKIDSMKIVAICDVDQEVLNKVGDREGISKDKRFQNIEEIINTREVDAIVSVVPNNLHARVLELCILHQKPIMTEKPFTLNFKEAENLNSLYKKSPIPCAVGFIHRYTPSFQYARDLLKDNKIGKVHHIEVKYQQSFGSCIFDLPYLWRFNKTISGTGVLGDLGAHMIDSARFFVGEFHSVSALMKTLVDKRKDPITNEERKVEVDDLISFQAVFESNVVGTFVATRNAIGSSNQHEVTLYGDYGTLHVNIERPEEIDVFTKTDKGVVFNTERVPKIYNRTLFRDFADLILNDRIQDMPTFYDGYQNQKVIDRIIYSSENERFVKIN